MSAITDLLAAGKLPLLVELLGQAAVVERRTELDRVGVAPLWQVEQDLTLLGRYVTSAEARRAYERLLGNPGQFVHALYEIRVAAMLAPVAARLQLSPRVGKKASDVSAVINEQEIHVEVTTVRDIFPWDGVSWKKGEDILEPRSRATVATPFRPSSASDDQTEVEVPESEDIRQKIKHELTQLPQDGPAVVVVGTPGGRSLHVEEALYGDEILRSRHGSSVGAERVPNGLFALPDEDGGASRLSAVIWIKLAPHFTDVRVHSRLFVNPKADQPLAAPAAETLLSVFDRRAVLCREVERIRKLLVERYRPDRIILFGSLAHPSPDYVHQWSDIDLFIVRPTQQRFSQRGGEVVNLIEPRVAVNIIVYTPEELARAVHEGGFFIRDEILGRGRVLYP